MSGLPSVVVADFLEQDLRDALGKAAVDLTGGEQRIDHGATVIDGDEIADPDAARLSVDLDDGDMTAERKGAGLLEVRGMGQRRLRALVRQRRVRPTYVP